MRRTFALAACVCLFSFAVQGWQEPAATYAQLLEKVNAKDPAADFAALRFAFMDADAYSPYGGDTASQNALDAALKEKNYGKAAKLAEKILATNFVDISGHLGASRAQAALKNSEKAEFHRYVGQGLINSILQSGDGKTPQTAYVVISPDEEYALFNYWGFRTSAQSIVHKDGHVYDLMTGTDQKTNEKVCVYFNVDKPYQQITGQVVKKKS